MSRILALPLALVLLGGCAPKRIHELEDQLTQRDVRINELQTQNQGYVLQIDTLKAELSTVDAKNKELASLYRQITDEFGPEIEAGQASLIVFPDRSVISIGDGITFASGSAAIKSDSDVALDQLASFLRTHPERRFQVEGHTDDQPIHNARYSSNWELGAARAVAVVDALIDRGVPAAQLSAATFAETEPMATNEHPMGMATNRRVSIAVQTSVKESGAQQALLEAAQRSGGAVYATTERVDDTHVATISH